MIHVVHIIPTLNFGGAERLLVDLANSFDKEKYRFSIIVLFDQMPLAKEITADVPIYIVPKKGKLSFHLLKDLRAKLIELKPDIVHTHLFGANLWGRLAAHALRLPVVTTEHGVNLSDSCLKKLVMCWLRDYSDVYISPSKFTANFLQKQYHIKKKVVVIPNGIKVEKFVNVPKLPEAVDKFKLLLLGRLDLTKGHAIALKALAGLKQYPWELEIAGAGPDQNKIENLIKRFGLSDLVKILPATKDVPAVLAGSQIVLAPSIKEAFGLTALEAMASGRAVIASDAGGLPELVKDGETGFVFKNKDIKSLQEKLRFVFENFVSATAVAEKAKISAKNFSIEKMVAEYGVVYQSLAK